MSTTTQVVCNPGTYTVTVMNMANGCTATDEVVVTQNTTPPTVTIASPAPLTCTTTSIVLTAGSTSGVVYSWSNGATPASIVITQPGTYTVTATNMTNGCSVSSSVIVTENRMPPNANAGMDQTITCTNTCVTVGVPSTTPGVSYTWSNGAGFAPSVQVCAAGIYTVTITNAANGCIATDNVVVTPNQSAPVITITGATSFCAGSTNTLTATATTNATFMWNAAVSSPTITLQTGGTYTVTATNTANGCTATKSVTVTLKARPTAAITQPTVPCAGLATSLLASGGGTYLWSTQATTASITLPASTLTPATYTVTVTGTNGCTATATRKPQYLTGTACTGTGGGGTGRTASSTIENVTLYPNPTDTYFNLVFGDSDWTDATITVTDLAGKIVTTMQKSYIAPSETMEIATGRWTAGVYFVTICNKDRLQTLKVVKMQ